MSRLQRVLVVVVLSLLVSPLATPRSAEAAVPTAADARGAAASTPRAGCTTEALEPTVTGYVVYGYARWRCSVPAGQRTDVNVTLERHRWNGWEVISQFSRSYGEPVYATFGVNASCQGVHTYRVVTWGYTGGYPVPTSISTSLRHVCP